MENIIINGIGAAAIGYLGYVAWKRVSGKGGCGCSSACPNQDKEGNCCHSQQRLPK